jgi:O-antigen/teichoic acid export membrane protein
MLSGLSVGIYMRVDAIMLKYLSGDATAGVYAAATRLSEVWYFLPVALASSVLPALLRAKEGDASAYNRKLQQYFDLSAGAAYVLAIPVAVLAGPIVRLLYGEVFSDAGPILAVHIWAGVFVFLGVARGQCLVNDGLSRFYALSTLTGAVVNVGLNAVLIPRFEGLGAAWATLLSYGCAAWLSSYFHRAARPLARLQANALLIPFRFWCYLPRL